MRCKVCDAILTDEEATHRDEKGQFMDTCFMCMMDEEDPWQDEPLPDWLDPDDFSSAEDISK